jgi:hypothetical protein
VFQDDLDQRFAGQLLGKRPGRGLVEPHQRRVQHEALVHAEAERDLQRLDGVVAAIGIAGEVGFAHPADEMADAAPPGDGGGEGEEQQIAAGHEGVGQPVFLHRKGDVTRERGVADAAQHAEVDDVILAQPRGPLRLATAHLLLHHKSLIQLNSMPLPIVESDGFNMHKTL